MFLCQVVIETRKTLAHPALWLGLAGLTILLAGFVLVQHAQIVKSYQPATGGLEQDLIAGLAFYTWIGSLVYAISAAVIAAFDYPDRSIQVWLARGVPRPTLLFARLAVVLIFALALVMYAVFAILAMAAVSRMIFFGTVDAALMNWSVLLPAALRVFWSALPYLALTVFLAVISRSPLFAAGGTVIFASVAEALLASQAHRFPTLVRYLPSQIGRALLENNAAISLAALPVEPAMPEMRAVLLLALMALALSGAALIVFSRQDLGG